MKYIKLLVGVIALLFVIVPVSHIFAQNNQKENSNNFNEREEIRRTYRIAPGSLVEVSAIRGSVKIESADIEVAEVYIERSAQNRADLERYKIGIESNPQSLTIKGETLRQKSGEGFGPDVLHQVTLKLPRRVNLFINRIGGDVRIDGDLTGGLSVNNVGGSLNAGKVDGKAQLSVISGGITIGQVAGQLEIKNVSRNVKIERAADSLSVDVVSGGVEVGDIDGQFIANNVGGSLKVGNVKGQVQVKVVSGSVNIGQTSRQVEIKNVSKDVKIARVVDSLNISVVTGAVSVRIAALGKSGVQIQNISGQVELQFKGETNAQLSTNNITGKIFIELPNISVQSRPNAYAINALIGKGGFPISINVVTNDVRLIRAE